MMNEIYAKYDKVVDKRKAMETLPLPESMADIRGLMEHYTPNT